MNDVESTAPSAVAPSRGHRALTLLTKRCPKDVLAVEDAFGEISILIDRTKLVDITKLLRDDPSTRYAMPVYVTAVDYLDREPTLPRFDVLYAFRSLVHNDVIRLVVQVSESDPHVPSLEQLFMGLDWHERETFDLFGIIFDEHHDLRRILLPLDWSGHPLRKDYISFGEPVAFTHNLEWALPAAERPSILPGEER